LGPVYSPAPVLAEHFTLVFPLAVWSVTGPLAPENFLLAPTPSTHS